jgi:hypothetical protein
MAREPYTIKFVSSLAQELIDLIIDNVVTWCE